MPQSILGILAAISLVPGYVYLVLTEDVRKPSSQRPLAELLQVVLIGMVTTGPACALIALLAPGRVLATLDMLQQDPADVESEQVRSAILLSIVLVLIALAAAWLCARVARGLAKDNYAPSVMQGTLGLRREDHGRFVGIHLADGSTIDGLLHAYNLQDDVESRVIALSTPIRRFAKGEVTDLPFDYFVAFGDQIQSVAMTQRPKRSAERDALEPVVPKSERRRNRSSRKARPTA